MAGAVNAQTIASQKEWIKPQLELMYLTSSRLVKEVEANTGVKPISTRPARVPLEILAGGKPRANNPDGGSFGRGSGPQEVYGQVSCTSFCQASEYTSLSDWATDGDDKAIKSYVSLTNARATETYAGFLDAAIAGGNGSNTLDTVVSTTTNGLVVNNANLFTDNQDIDCYSALTGGSGFIATITIDSVDIQNNTIWLTGAVPAGVGAGTFLVISGSAGVANSGIFGLLYYQVSGNAGSFLNIQRSAFPGKLGTPGIAVNGALTPTVVRSLEMILKLQLGIERADENDLIVHCNVDMMLAWENNAILVQRVVQNEVKGDQSVDMLKKEAVTVMAGRRIVANERALPGRVDMLALKKWSRVETKPLDYLEIGGQTLFPTYAIDGGINSSYIFYLVHLIQILQVSPRSNAFLSSVTIPKYLFNH